MASDDGVCNSVVSSDGRPGMQDKQAHVGQVLTMLLHEAPKPLGGGQALVDESCPLKLFLFRFTECQDLFNGVQHDGIQHESHVAHLTVVRASALFGFVATT